MSKNYPPERGYYDFPAPREPYARDVPYPRHSPPPSYKERRGGYADYYGHPGSGPSDFPERDYGRGNDRGPQPPPDVYDAGYREFRDVRDREALGPPSSRPYSPGRSRPPRGMSRGGGRY